MRIPTSRESIATSCRYGVAVRRQQAALVGIHAQRPAHADSRASLPTDTVALRDVAADPDTPAAKSRAKPAGSRCPPRKQTTGPGVEASEYRTSSTRVRDALSDSILWPMFGESAQQAPAP